MYALQFFFAIATITVMYDATQAELNSVTDIGNQLQKQPTFAQNPFALPYYSYQAMLQAYQNNNLKQQQQQQQQPKVQEQEKRHEIDLGEILGQKTQQQQPLQLQQQRPPVAPPMLPLTHFHHLPPNLPLAAQLPLPMQ